MPGVRSSGGYQRGELARVDLDPHLKERLAGLRVGGGVGGDLAHQANDLRQVALLEHQQSRLPPAALAGAR